MTAVDTSALPADADASAPIVKATALPLANAAFIAADVGGTHARVALVHADVAGVAGVADRAGSGSPGTIGVLRHACYQCADWPGLDAIVAHFLNDDGIAAKRGADPRRRAAECPVRAVLACAGVVHGDTLINTNLPWPVSLAALRQRLGLAHIDVINDFEALAHAVPMLTAADSRHLIGPDRQERPVDAGPVVVMGPGTGLGCAAVLPEGGGRHRVLATEAGQIALAAGTPREAAVVGWLAGGQTHVPVERVLSGPGLTHLYSALAAIDGAPVRCNSPLQVTAAAAAGTDAVAVETVQLFCGWLGSFAADLAMLYGATGGVLLAGGVVPALDTALRHGPFEARFLAKGVLQPWLRQVPVRLLDHGQLAVIGAARWSVARRGG